MVTELSINVNNLDKIKNDFWPEKIAIALDNSIKKSIVLLDRTAREETPVWVSGFLRAGFKEEFRSLYWRLYNSAEYAIDVHNGTWPHVAPFADIYQRATFKWLEPWAVRNSIAKKGTKANPFMDRTVEKTDNEIDDIFQWEIDKLVLEMNI